METLGKELKDEKSLYSSDNLKSLEKDFLTLHDAKIVIDDKFNSYSKKFENEADKLQNKSINEELDYTNVTGDRKKVAESRGKFFAEILYPILNNPKHAEFTGKLDNIKNEDIGRESKDNWEKMCDNNDDIMTYHKKLYERSENERKETKKILFGQNDENQNSSGKNNSKNDPMAPARAVAYIKNFQKDYSLNDEMDGEFEDILNCDNYISEDFFNKLDSITDKQKDKKIKKKVEEDDEENEEERDEDNNDNKKIYAENLKEFLNLNSANLINSISEMENMSNEENLKNANNNQDLNQKVDEEDDDDDENYDENSEDESSATSNDGTQKREPNKYDKIIVNLKKVGLEYMFDAVKKDCMQKRYELDQIRSSKLEKSQADEENETDEDDNEENNEAKESNVQQENMLKSECAFLVSLSLNIDKQLQKCNDEFKKLGNTKETENKEEDEGENNVEHGKEKRKNSKIYYDPYWYIRYLEAENDSETKNTKKDTKSKSETKNTKEDTKAKSDMLKKYYLARAKLICMYDGIKSIIESKENEEKALAEFEKENIPSDWYDDKTQKMVENFINSGNPDDPIFEKAVKSFEQETKHKLWLECFAQLKKVASKIRVSIKNIETQIRLQTEKAKNELEENIKYKYQKEAFDEQKLKAQGYKQGDIEKIKNTPVENFTINDIPDVDYFKKTGNRVISKESNCDFQKSSEKYNDIMRLISEGDKNNERFKHPLPLEKFNSYDSQAFNMLENKFPESLESIPKDYEKYFNDNSDVLNEIIVSTKTDEDKNNAQEQGKNDEELSEGFGSLFGDDIDELIEKNKETVNNAVENFGKSDEYTEKGRIDQILKKQGIVVDSMFDPRSRYYRKDAAKIENQRWQDYKSVKERMGEIYRGAPQVASQAKENAIKRNEPADLDIKKVTKKYKDISNSSFKDIDKKVDEYIKLNEKENFLTRMKKQSQNNNQLENISYQKTVQNRIKILKEEKKAFEKYWKENSKELDDLSKREFGFSSSIADKQKEEITRIASYYDDNGINKARSIVMGPKYNEKKEKIKFDLDFKRDIRLERIKEEQKEASEVISKNSKELNERIKSLGVELKPTGSKKVNDKVISNATIAPPLPTPKDLKKEAASASIPHFDAKQINSPNEAGYVITQMMNAQIDYLNQMKKMMENLQNQNSISNKK